MIEHVLLDSDGVIADFQAGAMKRFGYVARGETPEGVVFAHATQPDVLYPFGEWEIPSVIGVTPSDFWAHLHADGNFFATLEPFDYLQELIGICKQVGYSISSSPSKNPHDTAAKVEWWRKYIDPDFEDYMVGRNKWLMAHPTVLLIDDRPRNCDEFRRQRGSFPGGQAFLWPQYWNSAHASRDSRMTDLQRILSQH